MGLIATVKKFIRGDNEGTPVPEVELDPSDSDLYDAEIFAGSGVDAPPLPGDACHVEDGPGAGEGAVTGFLDPKNEGIAQPGERRTYGRDADGEIVAVVYLTRAGKVLLAEDKPAAPLSRSDKTDNMFQAVLTSVSVGINAAVSSTPGDGGKAALTAMEESLEELLETTACEKVEGT